MNAHPPQAIFLTQTQNSDDEFDIHSLIDTFELNLSIQFIEIEKADNKTLKKLANQYPNAPLLFLEKSSLILTMCNEHELIKVSSDWQSHQSRIVKAGKNSELLLKIAKLNNTMSVIDGTAGFGIDGLILASTGANVTLIEQNPMLFLMLKTEQLKMSQHKNWQKLMSRIDIQFGDSGDILKNTNHVDLIYLDPMFPNDSYKGAVNKNMQILHQFINPPTFDDEMNLFSSAMSQCQTLIIKRPISAPHFANMFPTQSMNNDVIRFDKYEGVMSI